MKSAKFTYHGNFHVYGIVLVHETIRITNITSQEMLIRDRHHQDHINFSLAESSIGRISRNQTV